MKNVYKFAEHNFEINNISDCAYDLLSGYESNDNPEFSLTVSSTDIDFEKIGLIEECKKERVAIPDLPLSSYELTAVYRKVVRILINYDVLLFHGSVVSVDNKAYMFIAKSGTGKSTHTRMWRELLGDKAIMVNDDKPLVKISKDSALAYGTPWNGKHHLGSNISAPLKGICILKRGKENSIKKIDIATAYPMLMQQIHRIPDTGALNKTMELIDRLNNSVSFYEMYCNISLDAANMAYKFMSEENQ